MKKVLFIFFLTTSCIISVSQSKVKCRSLCSDKTRNDIEKSIGFYKLRLAKYPVYEDSYYNLGLCYTKLREMNTAISYLDTLINLNPNYYGAFSNRGLCKIAIGDKKGACNDFQKSVNIGQDLKVIDNMKLSDYISAKCSIP